MELKLYSIWDLSSHLKIKTIDLTVNRIFYKRNNYIFDLIKQLNFNTMKNLKKISRDELKKVVGGKKLPTDYNDMCHGSAECAPYGLSCQVFCGEDTNGQWCAYRCV